MPSKRDSSEDEIVRPILGTTPKERLSNNAVSFTKAEHSDMLKKKHIQVKQKNLHDPTSNCPEF
jgi:hypothetical protein